MKWSELPKEYQDLEIPEIAKKRFIFEKDYISHKFNWSKTNEGSDFWEQCADAETIDDLPTLTEKEYLLPEKWCVRGYANDSVHNWFNEKLKREISTSIINYFHYPEIENNVCTSSAIENGYTEITYDQWVKYVRDSEKETIKITKDWLLENFEDKKCKAKESINPFYMIYLDGAKGSNVKHKDFDSANKEAERLASNTDRKVYILQTVQVFERELIIKKSLL